MKIDADRKAAAYVVAACTVSGLWFGASVFYADRLGLPGFLASILLLAGFIMLSAWATLRAAASPFASLRELLHALAESGLRERLFVTDADRETGRIQLELNSLMDRMEDTMSRQRQFVGAVSHDIRTPLTIMRGDIEVALARERSAEEYREILMSNLEEVERIRKMVEDLVTLARADYGEMGLNIRAVPMGSLVAEVREAFSEPARRKNLALDSYIEGDVRIEGDAARLRQLLHNLLDNAVNYTPEGGRVEVSLVTDRERDEVQMRVRDTGMGISSADLPHVFEPFYRGQPTRRTRHHGYGLGLSICEHVARAHGGRIAVESRQGPGSGTTFTVHLPVRPRRA